MHIQTQTHTQRWHGPGNQRVQTYKSFMNSLVWTKCFRVYNKIYHFHHLTEIIQGIMNSFFPKNRKTLLRKRTLHLLVRCGSSFLGRNVHVPVFHILGSKASSLCYCLFVCLLLLWSFLSPYFLLRRFYSHV